jgi:hypothetical protein
MRLPPPILVERIRPTISLAGGLFNQVRAAFFCIKRAGYIVPHPLPFKNIAPFLKPIFWQNKDWFFILATFLPSIYPEDRALVAL